MDEAGSVERDALITSCIPVVKRIVGEIMARVPGHVCRDDLTSAGLTALVQSSRTFDETRGVPFARYAANRVRGAMLDELRRIDWAPRSARRRARVLDTARGELTAALGRVPAAWEVAGAAGVTVAEMARNDEDIFRAQVVSMQGAQGADLDTLLPTAGPTPEQLVEDRERLAYLGEAVAELPERLRRVVTASFFEDRAMAEIGAELGVSETRVSQMRSEAVTLLRDALHHELDPTLLQPHERPDGVAARRRDRYFAAVASRHAAATNENRRRAS